MIDWRPYPPVVMRRYPHMAKIDAVVWTAFLQEHGKELGRCWYDIHVGETVQLPPDSPAYLYDVAEGISTKRIDAVAEWQDALLIVEVKPFGNAAALGQALVYGDCLQEMYTDLPRIIPMIVCAEIDRDVAAIAPNYGVSWIEVSVPN